MELPAEFFGDFVGEGGPVTLVEVNIGVGYVKDLRHGIDEGLT